VFGLPHNYLTDNVSGEKHDRRASPLLVHVHELAPNSYALISIVLRAEFLPDIEKTQDGRRFIEPEKINAGGKLVPQNIKWQLIDQFLDGYVGHRNDKSNTPYFPDKQTWFGAMS
jgi:CRISPR-associated protein Cmr1